MQKTAYRSPDEKWQIVRQDIKSGKVSETCRRYEIAPNLFYRWKGETEQEAKAALGGRIAAVVKTEKDRRIRQLERALARKALEIKILKRYGGVSCGEFHSQACDLVIQGRTATLVATTRAISQSSLY